MKLSKLNILSIGHTIQMVGVIYQGEGQVFLCFFPEDAGHVMVDRPIPIEFHPNDGGAVQEVCTIDMGPAEWERFLQQTDLLEVEALVRDKSGAVGKAVLRKSQRHIEQGVSWRVYKRDGYACRYCWTDDVPLTVDHVVCWEENGPSIEANLLSSCRKCNRVRGNLPYVEWLRHPHYLANKEKLPTSIQEANERLVETLDSIPRRTQPRSR
jgi:hypothetical protein